MTAADDRPAPADAEVWRLGTWLHAAGKQLAEQWPAIERHGVLYHLAEGVSLLLDELAAGHPVDDVLAALAADARRLPQVDADITGPHRGGAS